MASYCTHIDTIFVIRPRAFLCVLTDLAWNTYKMSYNQFASLCQARVDIPIIHATQS